MNLMIDTQPAIGYKSRSQIGRVISEAWVRSQLYCPFCENDKLMKFESNRPAADFFCPYCNEEYELKSKHGKQTFLLADGAYTTMIQRIASDVNPNFLIMFYSGSKPRVDQLLIIPKYFISSSIVQQRKPLSSHARRAGWIGCNLHLDQIPSDGMIYIVKNGHEIDVPQVHKKVQETKFIGAYKQENRGWLLDTIQCLQRIQKMEFSLEDVYTFSDEMTLRHPDNHHIRDKLRQQLQLLRDQGYIEFLGNGLYRRKHIGSVDESIR